MNISLIGMPACGKTTTAKTLKKFFDNYKLVDTDEEIVKNKNLSVEDIFKKYGEKYFRQIETEILKEILKNDNQIISTGGGIIKSDENLKILKEKSVVVYLETDIKTLIERAKKSKERPLLNDCNIKEKLENLLKERESRYKKAHYIIKEGQSPEDTAKTITEEINADGRSKN